METRKWIHPITKEEEIVEIGSTRDIELVEKMHSAGLWDSNDPNLPEGCLTVEEFGKFLDNQPLPEERYQQYLKRKEDNNQNKEV